MYEKVKRENTLWIGSRSEAVGPPSWMIFRFYALENSSIIQYHALYMFLLLCVFEYYWLKIETLYKIYQQCEEGSTEIIQGIIQNLSDFLPSSPSLQFKSLAQKIWNWRNVFGGRKLKHFLTKAQKTFQISSRRS